MPMLGCASGIKSAVFLAAIMPATRATARASPFFKVALHRAVKAVELLKRIVEVAVAVRWVGVLEVIEIMCAAPDEVRWERVVLLLEKDGVEEEAVDWRNDAGSEVAEAKRKPEFENGVKVAEKVSDGGVISLALLCANL